MSDNVLHPSHYCDGEIEVIDYIRDKLPPEGFRDYCKGNALKYISRAGKKGDAEEDLRKAIVYLAWAIDPTAEPGKDEPAPAQTLEKKIGGLKIENAKLRAEIERLKNEGQKVRKAADEEKPKVRKAAGGEAPKGKKPIDHGKIVACFKGGRSVAWIADEMGIATQTVYNHLQKEGLWKPEVKG